MQLSSWAFEVHDLVHCSLLKFVQLILIGRRFVRRTTERTTTADRDQAENLYFVIVTYHWPQPENGVLLCNRLWCAGVDRTDDE